MAYLHFLSGPLAGKRAHLKSGRISVGRAEGNKLRVNDPSVAPRHLVLVREEDEYSLYIDASRPPVAVNGKQVVNTALKDGDKVRIGSVEAIFHLEIPQRAAPNPLDFFADQPQEEREPEILSLDDAEDLPSHDDRRRRTGKNGMRALIAFLVLCAMLIGSLFIFRKELWKEAPAPEKQDQLEAPARESASSLAS